jgi:hypothetical protein
MKAATFLLRRRLSRATAVATGIVAAVTATVAVVVVVDMVTVVAVVKTTDNNNTNFELLVSCCRHLVFGGIRLCSEIITRFHSWERRVFVPFKICIVEFYSAPGNPNGLVAKPQKGILHGPYHSISIIHIAKYLQLSEHVFWLALAISLHTLGLARSCISYEL